MWQVFTIVLAVVLAVVLFRYQLLKKEIAGMARAMGEIDSSQTNRQLTVTSQRREVTGLANAINKQYEEVAADKAANRAAMDEVRQSMANISHDLRTPLTSILGYLKLLRKGGNTPEQTEKYLEVAYDKAGSLNRLVNGLFELSRLETGGYVFEHERLDAAALLGEELAGAYAGLEAKGALPEVRLPGGPLWMIGDRGALGRVFSNLLQNMAKHGRAPKEVSAGAEGERVVFRFSNGAPGLAAGDAERIFQRFFTGDRMRSGENTGLGLSIVKEFTEGMDGEIGAELRENILTITLKWPAAL